jgi:hypothetical protein
MKRVLLSCWRLYTELVHQTLFLTIVAHEVPRILDVTLITMRELVEKHEPILMLLAATALVLGSRAVEALRVSSAVSPPAQERRAIRAKKRDRLGRFVAQGRKRSRRADGV